MKSTNKWIGTVICFIILFFLAACGDTNNHTNNNNSDTNTNVSDNVEENNSDDVDKDITINWMYPWGEERFMEMMGDDIEDTFPHVTINVLEGNADHPESIENLIADDKITDIVTTGQLRQISVLEEYGLAYDLDDLIEESDFDLERIEPTIIEYTRNLDPNNEHGLYAIPHSRPTWGLFYDKDVFDTLGESYPEDGMTWEEVIELARKLTKEIDGVQYRGLDLDIGISPYTQFSQNSVDPETNEVLIKESEAYKRYLQMIKDVVDIPGNYNDDTPLTHWGGELENGNIAMTPIRSNWGYLENENIDIATYPVWEGYEGINPEPNGAAWMITEPGNHKEEILKIIDYVLSDEVQMELSKEGDVEGGASVLVNPDIHEVFGEYNEAYADKHLPALFEYEYAVGPEKRAKYSDDVISSAPEEFIESGKDINEFLRILQEEAEENVRSQIESE